MDLMDCPFMMLSHRLCICYHTEYHAWPDVGHLQTLCEYAIMPVSYHTCCAFATHLIWIHDVEMLSPMMCIYYHILCGLAITF
jgi:hypothetical protein